MDHNTSWQQIICLKTTYICNSAEHSNFKSPKITLLSICAFQIYVCIYCLIIFRCRLARLYIQHANKMQKSSVLNLVKSVLPWTMIKIPRISLFTTRWATKIAHFLFRK